MSERILFLTGRLAEPQLHRVLDSMQPTDFAYQVRNIGISVAALMTPSLIQRRLADADGADRILLPGRCKGGLDGLTDHFGVPVERGPEDLKDLPVFFGRKGEKPDLSGHDCLIFAEITDAPLLDVAAIMERAAAYKEAGAEVIDLGCLPDTPFPHLEEAISALKAEGYRVSVDSAEARELLRGGKAGADYLLSLTEETLSIADEVDSVPVLIPAIPGDMDSLKRAIETFQKTGKPFLADPILDPLHFGFTESLVRYRDLRRGYPDIDILMGIGNLTELTDADTTGITALLMGVVSELDIAAVLVVQVSAHCRRAVREADLARRIMSFARQENSLPVGIDPGLMALHDRRVAPYTDGEIADLAAMVRDPSYRVQVSETGLHVFNRDGHHRACDPFSLFSKLGVEKDGSHAFYLGVELARAQIAWQLGKNYTQDQMLDWGVAADANTGEDDDGNAPGHRLVVVAEKRAAKKRARGRKGEIEKGKGGKK